VETPYLESPLREAFDAWLETTVARYSPPLAFAEIRRGAQALSSLYVERRRSGAIAARSVRGRGKRAALATYFAPLHFLTVHHALGAFDLRAAEPIRRVLDLGCGSGATGAAIATARLAPPGAVEPDPPRVVALDVSGWALGEAEATYAAFGLGCRMRRGALPGSFPRVGPSDLIALGWVVNELDDRGRTTLLGRLRGALESGASLLLAEPLSERPSPWWSEWAEALAPLGAAEEWVRTEIERPNWIASLDRATRLDHRTLGARVLCAVRAPQRRGGGAAQPEETGRRPR
jgi:SAM-dependent methyltransferase